MEMKDLKTGHQIRLKDGSRLVVLLNTEAGNIATNGTKYVDLAAFVNSDLTNLGNSVFRIEEVYSPKFITEYLNGFNWSGESIWKRQEPTKMTMEEINEHFGKEIEIVEG